MNGPTKAGPPAKGIKPPNLNDSCLINIQIVSRDRNHILPLEAIPIPNFSTMTLWDMRNMYCPGISCLPNAFLFLSTQRFPIKMQYESNVLLSCVVNDNGVCEIMEVLDDFEIFGILLYTGELSKSHFIGSIASQNDESLRILRDKITTQIEILKQADFLFLDRSTWPVKVADERSCHVGQIKREDSAIWITLKETLLNYVQSAASTQPHLTSILASGASALTCIANAQRSQSLNSESPRTLRRESSRDSTSSSSGQRSLSRTNPRHQFDGTDGIDSDSDPARHNKTPKREILISYVRAESAHVTSCIKELLTEMGYSVYLDVDEIKIGSDWQDSLNDAVSQCDIFVPLITQRYGETLWTNREIKLADVLDKYILPINFIDEWPPRSLAIQFATTQFIPWTVELQSSEISLRHEAVKVCTEIAEKCRSVLRHRHVATPTVSDNNTFTSPPAITMRRSMMMRYGSLMSGGTASMASIKEDQGMESNIKEVVICAHPAQTENAKNIFSFIEKQGYKVWCSATLFDQAAVPLSRSMTNGRAINDINATILPSSHEVPRKAPLVQRTFSLEIDDQTKKRLLAFQLKADRAGAVIVLLSSAFANCITCKKKLFYCEQRKAIIPVQIEDFTLPGWLKLLLGKIAIEHYDSEEFRINLERRLRDAFDPDMRCVETPDVENESHVLRAATLATRELPQNKLLVYISGSTSLHSDLTLPLARLIGRHLADIKEVCLVTGGFRGVGSIISTEFAARCGENNANCDRLWHLLPVKDNKDFSKVANQQSDGRFLKCSLGKTIFCGRSVHERESIAAHVAHLCILLEGGPGAAHEAEQFAWLDKVVLPVPITGGAAGGGIPGRFCVNERVFRAPPAGLLPSLWESLISTNTTVEVAASAVASIVSQLAASDYSKSVLNRPSTEHSDRFVSPASVKLCNENFSTRKLRKKSTL